MSTNPDTKLRKEIDKKVAQQAVAPEASYAADADVEFDGQEDA